MPEFIIDANLPFRILKWQNDLFAHVLNINPLWNDEEIWNYAKENNLIIITKDKDFRLKQIMKALHQKLFIFKFGNLKFKQFEEIINLCWDEVEKLIKIHSLINIYQYTIEAIK